MTLTVKISKDVEYLYFQAGKESLYIAPKNNPSKAKTENVIKALNYSKERADHYLDSFEELLSLLPADIRKQYVSKYGTKLKTRIKKQSSKTS